MLPTQLIAFSTLLIGSFGFPEWHQQILHNHDHPSLIPGVPTDLREIAEPAATRSKNSYATHLQGSEILQFDDLTQPEPRGNISLYQNVHFSGWELLNVSSAYESGVIAGQDLDCASSAPNALLGRRESGEAWPRFYLSPSSSSSPSPSSPPSTLALPKEDPPLFDLVSLTIKPLGPIAAGTVIYFTVWNITDGRPVLGRRGFVFYGRGGYPQSLRLRFTGFWKAWGSGFNVFEAWGVGGKGEDGEKGGDVRFCLDDLEIARW